MKTILQRMKTVVDHNNNSGGTLEYVRGSEVLHPDLALTATFVPGLPKVLFVPRSTIEEWAASGRKNVTHVVTAHLVLLYHQRESSIIGDASRPGGQGKGITDFVSDFLSVFRGHRLASGGTNYLSKPLDVDGVDYSDPIVVENAHLIVATVTMKCQRMIDQASLPGDV